MKRVGQVPTVEEEPPFTFFSLAFLLADGDVTKIATIRKSPIHWSLSAAELKLQALARMTNTQKKKK